MSSLRGLAGPVKRRAKTALGGGGEAVVHLIHAIKNEIVGRLDQLSLELSSGLTSLSEENSVAGINVTKGAALSHSAVELGQANNAELLALRFELARLEDAVREIAPTVRLGLLADQTVRLVDIDQPTAFFLNYANSHSGPLADVNLWINNPVVIEWNEGSASVGAVNERIMEVPFVMQALAPLPPGSRVLDVGGSESTLALSLASLGYKTTVVDPQGYPFEHPNLEVILQAVEDVAFAESFDAVIFLSAVEHFGLGYYTGNPEPVPDADYNALKTARSLLKRDGLLVLTVPYGPAETTELERIYDLEGLTGLLSGWKLLTARIGQSLGKTTWTLESNALEEPSGPGRVAMVVAKPES